MSIFCSRGTPPRLLAESQGQNLALTVLCVSDSSGEVSRGEKMLYSGTDPESYITEYTLVYED